MKTNFSVVIICFNEAEHIYNCIQSALKVTDDVVVVDSFSSDETPSICKDLPVQFHQIEWQGYGQQKNWGNELAKYEWVFSLDADEVISEDLMHQLPQLDFGKTNVLYAFKRKNFLGDKMIEYGAWGRDKVCRLFNKKVAHWNAAKVHESIVSDKKLSIQTILAPILHYSFANSKEHVKKSEHYSSLAADKMLLEGKSSTITGAYVKAIFRFLKEYFILLGFLDGKEGFHIAKVNSRETLRKYKLLHQKTKGK